MHLAAAVRRRLRLLWPALVVALAADPPGTSTDYNQLFVSKLAKILGKDEKQVGDAVLQARNEAINETLDEAVKAGRLTKEQADAMKQHMQQGGSGTGHCGGTPTNTGGAKSFGSTNRSPLRTPTSPL